MGEMSFTGILIETLEMNRTSATYVLPCGVWTAVANAAAET